MANIIRGGGGGEGGGIEWMKVLSTQIAWTVREWRKESVLYTESKKRDCKRRLFQKMCMRASA
jgi:hypothetical protein